MNGQCEPWQTSRPCTDQSRAAGRNATPPRPLWNAYKIAPLVASTWQDKQFVLLNAVQKWASLWNSFCSVLIGHWIFLSKISVSAWMLNLNQMWEIKSQHPLGNWREDKFHRHCSLHSPTLMDPNSSFSASRRNLCMALHVYMFVLNSE